MNDGAGTNGDGDVLHHKFVESGFLNGDLIGAGLEIEKREIALSTGLELCGNPCVLVAHGNVRSRHGGSGGIGHCSFKPSRGRSGLGMNYS